MIFSSSNLYPCFNTIKFETLKINYFIIVINCLKISVVFKIENRNRK